MILWLCTGLIVFDEARFYTGFELLGIAGSITLCCIGINFLVRKTNMLKEARLEENKASKETV